MDNKPTLKNHARRRIIFWSIFIVLTLGAMTWTFYRDFGGGNAFAVWEDIRSQLSRNWWWLVLAIGAMIFARCCMILFSGTVFHLFTGKMHLKTAFSNNMVKNFYGKVAQPAGGYPFCMYYLSKQKHLPDGVAITLPVFNYTLSHIMDFFLGISAIILMTTNVFNTTEQLPTWILITASIGIASSIIVSMSVFLSLISPRISRWIATIFSWILRFVRLSKDREKTREKIIKKMDKSRECIKMLFRSKRIFICFPLVVMSRLATLSIGFFVLKSFGFYSTHGWGWAEIVVLSILVQKTVFIVPIPGRAGVVEMTMYGVYSMALANAPGIAAGALAVLFVRLIKFYLPLAFEFVAVLVVARRDRRRELACTYCDNEVK